MGQRILVISSHYLFQIFGPGEQHYRVISDALPSDVEILNSLVTFEGGELALKLQSKEWSPSPEGHPIPRLDLRMERIVPAEQDTWRERNPLL